MDEVLRSRLLALLDASPASVEGYRRIVRALVRCLPNLDPLEKEIMSWDASGRDAGQFEHLRSRAWAFPEIGEAAGRRRLFAGFVTSTGGLDGHDADYLIDHALASNIAAPDIYVIMNETIVS